MSEVLNIDFRKGTFIEKHSKLVGVNVGNSITRQQKGLAYEARQATPGQVTFPNLTALNFGTGAFSVVCAMRMGDFINIGDIDNVIFANNDFGSTSGLGFSIRSTQLLRLLAREAGDGSAITCSDAGALNDGLYHLIYFTFDGVTYKGYVDNVKETEEKTNVRNVTNANSFIVGRDSATNTRSNSDIAYIKAYDHELTEQERSKLYSEFLNSSLIQKQKSGFVYPKPTENHDAGIVAAYNMVPVDGVISDLSGNGNTGTITGALATLDGMNFDGVDDAISISSTNFGKSHTINLRVNPGTLVDDVLISNGTSNNIVYIFDAVRIRYNAGAAGIITFTVPAMITGQNYNITVIRNGTSVNLYLNGVESSSGTLTLASDDDLILTNIGGYSPFYFKGTITDLKIYDIAFTEQQAIDYHNQFANRVALKENFADYAVGDKL